MSWGFEIPKQNGYLQPKFSKPTRAKLTTLKIHKLQLNRNRTNINKYLYKREYYTHRNRHTHVH